MAPYYMIMRLPGEARAEFVLMLPMVPSQRENMIAWLAARCDPPDYGKVVVYEFPKDKLVYGPFQIEARIQQNTDISQQISLWNQMGSRVIRGHLLVVPIENSILYVSPLYLRAATGQLPELKRVIAAYGDRVVMEETLGAALAALFKETAPPPARPGEAGAATVGRPADARAREALAHYDRAIERLKAGDWCRLRRRARCAAAAARDARPRARRSLVVTSSPVIRGRRYRSESTLARPLFVDVTCRSVTRRYDRPLLTVVPECGRGREAALSVFEKRHDQMFPVLSAAQIESRAVSPAARRAASSPATVMVEVGELAAPVWLVLAGSIEVAWRDGLGRETAIDGEGPGQFSGEISQLASHTRSRVGRAGREGCTAFRSTAAHLRALHHRLGGYRRDRDARLHPAPGRADRRRAAPARS